MIMITRKDGRKETQMIPAPKLTFTLPDPVFAVTLRMGSWTEFRCLVDASHCTWTAKRVGLFSKRFEVRGTPDQMQLFCDLMWRDDLFGREFRNEIRKVAQ